MYGQGYFPASRGPFRVRFSTPFTGGHYPYRAWEVRIHFLRLALHYYKLGYKLGSNNKEEEEEEEEEEEDEIY